jgi:hypothetical protein
MRATPLEYDTVVGGVALDELECPGLSLFELISMGAPPPFYMEAGLGDEPRQVRVVGEHRASLRNHVVDGMGNQGISRRGVRYSGSRVDRVGQHL